MPTSRMIDHALQYAGRGWRVFALNGKVPLKGTRGFKDATTDAAAIGAWWRRWPRANIGIATGNHNQNGHLQAESLIVLDVDGTEGLAELKALVAKHGPLPATLAARTGNGLHLYFAGSGVRSSARGKLHVRGTGGYVVAPPSVHPSGRLYQWIDTALTVAPLPDWLKEWMVNGSSQKDNSTVKVTANRLPAYLGGLPMRGLASQALEAIKAVESTRPVPDVNEIARMLAFISAKEREIWRDVGMILKDIQILGSSGTDLGFEIWNTWSQSCPEKYPGVVELERQWASFGRTGRSDRVGMGSLFAMAKAGGWIELPPTAYSVHANVKGGGADDHENVSAQLPPQFAEPTRSSAVFPDTDKNNNPRSTCRNARVAINGLGISCSHDTFHRRMLVGGRIMDEYAGEISDDAVQMLRVMIGQTYGFDPGLMNTHDAVIQECLQKPFDPVCDYLETLQWDGAPRLETWFSRYLGAADTPLYRAMARISLVAAVRRAYEPGIKFDQIIVLEGPEGRGKSGAIKILAGEDNFSDQTILPLHDKEQQEALQGVWLYEIADLTGIGRAEVEKIKAFASRTVDRARPAYGRSRVDRPRRCIFFATTNNETYLKSQTGNRRFWPVVTGQIDLEGLARDRDQLWAEAVVLEGRGAGIMLGAELWGQAAELQASRVDQDPWDDLLAEVNGVPSLDDAGHPEERITTKDILQLRLNIPPDRQHDTLNKRLAYVMRRLGWEGPKVIRVGDSVARGYFRSISFETYYEALRKRVEKSKS